MGSVIRLIDKVIEPYLHLFSGFFRVIKDARISYISVNGMLTVHINTI